MKLLEKFYILFCKAFKKKNANDYPATFYRGISDSGGVNGKYLTEAAFRFDEKGHNPERTDNKRELSINWNDNPNSLDVLLNQHKPGKTNFQFSVGYTEVYLEELHNAFKCQIKNGDLSYERRPIMANPSKDVAENPYHGNLLINGDLDKLVVKTIQCALASIASARLTLRN